MKKILKKLLETFCTAAVQYDNHQLCKQKEAMIEVLRRIARGVPEARQEAQDVLIKIGERP